MSNVCNCPTPPGGQVVCEPRQMAVCIIENGIARHQCLDPINDRDPFALVNWALSEVTGEPRNSFTRVTGEDLKILIDGNYRTARLRATFSLPDKIKYAVDFIIRNRGGNDRQAGRERSR